MKKGLCCILVVIYTTPLWGQQHSGDTTKPKPIRSICITTHNDSSGALKSLLGNGNDFGNTYGLCLTMNGDFNSSLHYKADIKTTEYSTPSPLFSFTEKHIFFTEENLFSFYLTKRFKGNHFAFVGGVKLYSFNSKHTSALGATAQKHAFHNFMFRHKISNNNYIYNGQDIPICYALAISAGTNYGKIFNKQGKVNYLLNGSINTEFATKEDMQNINMRVSGNVLFLPDSFVNFNIYASTACMQGFDYTDYSFEWGLGCKIAKTSLNLGMEHLNTPRYANNERLYQDNDKLFKISICQFF